MRTLFTLDIKDYNPAWTHRKRPSARAIIVLPAAGADIGTICADSLPLSMETTIVLVYAGRKGYYKFPGGGIRDGENDVQALMREIREECGLSVIPESVRGYGAVLRLQKSDTVPDVIFEQRSAYYFCDVARDVDGGLKLTAQNLDDYEREDDFALRTVSIKDAVAANRCFDSDDRFDLAMVARDTRVLEGLCGIACEPPRGFARMLLEDGVQGNLEQ